MKDLALAGERSRLPVSLTVLFAALLPKATEGQMAAPRESLWGNVYEHPEGLSLGSVEALAGLLVAMTVLFSVNTFLTRKQRRLVAMANQAPLSEKTRLLGDLRRLRRHLSISVYLLVPILGIATILLAGKKAIFGVEVASWAVLLSLMSLAFGGIGLLSRSPPAGG